MAASNNKAITFPWQDKILPPFVSMAYLSCNFGHFQENKSQIQGLVAVYKSVALGMEPLSYG